ncbi:hypothetical protein E3O66_20245 [Salmonella enterica subsp. enterica serovar Oslo]|nr:hypothetical protein [Salmonella enterica subsp. enterica serovar Oslo]ECB6051838.1 hypothetical protein [Salmonella enterica subsp. enterica serovar Oslo]ECB6630527.1 hypothetical protein [Salmonella enterica subsp. enterica serovar Oslo]ECF0359663.1 hypothetical protein [Salmonella enterica subsp. enterica serovar Oslo]ECF0667151.1 hypothetical protein [Salmonella enterica subsp. enterica serovar Oslo]
MSCGNWRIGSQGPCVKELPDGSYALSGLQMSAFCRPDKQLAIRHYRHSPASRSLTSPAQSTG